MKESTLLKVGVLILCFLLGLGMILFLLNLKQEDAITTEMAEAKARELNASADAAVSQIITYKGKKYKQNPDIKNYLFIGVDEREDDFVDEDLTPGEAGQADCLILLSINTETKKANILQINRNAMTELDIYSEIGEVAETMNGQICLQYAYSRGGKRSCYATKRTVEELLFGTNIDAYFAMSLPSIAGINDALGGVDVTMDQDYTWINEAFEEGETVHLQGELATQFVQTRDTEEFNSVQDRMERQTSYVIAMITSLKEKEDNALYNMLKSYLGKGIITDLSAKKMYDLKNYNYNTDKIYYLPGEMIQGEKYEEYIVDNDELEEMVIDLFYEEE